MMGGNATDTDGPVVRDNQGAVFYGLFASGKLARTSVHGANRTGRNWLPDTLVFGRRAGKTMD